MNNGEAQVLAPVFIIVAGVTSSTTFAKELGHLNSNLRHGQLNWQERDSTNWNEIINRVLYRSYSFTHLGKHIHQLGHYVTVTLGIDEAGGLAQIPHPAGTSCVQNNLSMRQKLTAVC